MINSDPETLAAATLPTPNLSSLDRAMDEAQDVIDEIRTKGIDTPCPINDVPVDTTLRNKLEQALGSVRFEMIRLCDKGVTSKSAIHRFAEQRQAGLVFPKG